MSLYINGLPDGSTWQRRALVYLEQAREALLTELNVLRGDVATSLLEQMNQLEEHLRSGGDKVIDTIRYLFTAIYGIADLDLLRHVELRLNPHGPIYAPTPTRVDGMPFRSWLKLVEHEVETEHACRNRYAVIGEELAL